VAVYVELDEGQQQSLAAVYSASVGAVEAFEGVAAGSINTIYKVTASAGVFYLRITDARPMADLVYEKDVLVHLRSRNKALGFAVPELVATDGAGFFLPIDDRLCAMVFKELTGRELGVF